MSSQTGSHTGPAAEAKPCRKFSVSDAMAFIAGAALILAGGSRFMANLAEQVVGLSRTIWNYDSPSFRTPPGTWRRRLWMQWSTVLWYGFRVIQVVLLSMTLTFLLVRLRKPRPSILSLPRQPGTAAGLAIVFGLFWVTGWMHRLFFGKFHDATLTAVSVGGAVALAWGLLAVVGVGGRPAGSTAWAGCSEPSRSRTPCSSSRVRDLSDHRAMERARAAKGCRDEFRHSVIAAFRSLASPVLGSIPQARHDGRLHLLFRIRRPAIKGPSTTSTPRPAWQTRPATVS